MLLEVDSDVVETADDSSLPAIGKYEKELEEWLAENLDELYDNVPLWTIHQERTARAEADIIALDDAGNLFLFELKREEADYKAIGQLLSYTSNVSQWNYDDLEEKTRQYHSLGSQNTLRGMHKEEFGLKHPLEKEEFNKEIRLIIVGERADSNLKNIIEFLRENYSVPATFVGFSVHELSDDTKVIYFNTKEADRLIEITTEESEKHIEKEGERKVWWANTNKKSAEDIHDYIFEEEIVASYGPEKFKNKLEKAEEGDKVFAYVVKSGIRAMGTIQKGEVQSEKIEGHTRYSRPVNWDVILPSDDPIRADEIRGLGYENFRGTFRKIHNQDFVEKLSETMQARKRRSEKSQ